MNTTNQTLRTLALSLALSLAFAIGASLPARAQSTLSDASLLSGLPIAVSVAAPVMIFSAGVTLTVVAVQASATGTVCVLERASDGARASITLAGQMAGASLTAVGTGVTVLALGSGWLLSAAGQVIAFVPNAIGASLLYNERVTR